MFFGDWFLSYVIYFEGGGGKGSPCGTGTLSADLCGQRPLLRGIRKTKIQQNKTGGMDWDGTVKIDQDLSLLTVPAIKVKRQLHTVGKSMLSRKSTHIWGPGLWPQAASYPAPASPPISSTYSEEHMCSCLCSEHSMAWNKVPHELFVKYKFLQ